jgi:hypothetical protein
MSSPKVVLHLVVGVLWSATLFAQQRPAAVISPTMLEFPVVLQQNVEAGKMAVGTKIQAKLTVATLVNGTVIPKDAIFYGVVTESAPKAAKHPSRLAIRMDSVQWKGGSETIKACLTPWYFPNTVAGGPNLQYRPPEPPNKTWNGEGQYPSTDSRVYQPFPGGDSEKNAGAVPDTTSTRTSNRHVWMKDVAAAPAADGGIALVSRRSSIKLDKVTTYVLVAGSEGK